jgi:ribokinase
VIQDDQAPTGVASITVDAAGANANLNPADIRAAEAVIAGANVVLLQLEIPFDTVETAVQIAAGYGVPIILNPAPAQDLPDELLAKVSILTPNEVEAEMLTGFTESRREQAALKVLATGTERVIITLGKRGVFYADKPTQFHRPAYPVSAVDTTGAGDVFNGALAAFYSAEFTIEETLKYASAAAAISVTRIGAQTAAPSLAEIHHFLIKHQ